MEWYEECRTLADRFGLAPWVVAMLCLLRGYRPEKDLGLMAMEAEWPRIRVVTERVETPPNYPPEAASQLQKEASQLGRELQRRLGYATRQRLRSSPLVSMAETLKVDKAPLPNGVYYEIIDKAYNDDELVKDQQRRKQIKSRRHKLRKRLVEPYQQDTSSTE